MSATSCLLRRWLLILLLLLAVAPGAQADTSPIDADERVIFFPTAAVLSADGQTWRIPIRGWVFEPEHDDPFRVGALGQIADLLDLAPGTLEAQRFQRIARWFLVDNERGHHIPIRFDGRTVTLAASGANGHFQDMTELDRERAERMADEGWLRFHAVSNEREPRRFEGKSRLVDPSGVSVISDIDDTIRISSIADRREMLRRVFVEPFEPVPGMAGVYQEWADRGAVFHYVSGSPWQLYPPLEAMMDAAGFPAGSFHLRFFRFRDENVFSLLESPRRMKLETIGVLLDRFPDRRFILIGDDTEHDPQVYAALARDHPDQVIAIYIRHVGDGPIPMADFEEIFHGIPEGRWAIFREADELAWPAAE